MATVLLRKTVAAARVGYSVRHLERLAALGQFPRPIQIGPRATGWIEAEVESWLAAQIARSRKNAA